ncbi:MAG: hypothetical protein AAGJ82_07745 [Bacteroidota bacterium]
MSKYLAFFAVLFVCGLVTPSWAQDGSARPEDNPTRDQKVQFNGLGRTILNNTALTGELLETDSTTARGLTDGEFLLDVNINAQPNDKTEVQGILRIRNEFGGFFGAGVDVEVRELWARGLIGDVLRYRVGDFDHKMTPYTFFLPDEEGMVNEAALFQPQKDVIYYEQFYTGNNERRLQGGHLDFGLNFPAILNDLDAEAFIARIRPTDFFTTPTRLVGGGSLNLTTQRLQDTVGAFATVGVNWVNTWDDLQVGAVTSGIRNNVLSVNFDVLVLENKQLKLNVLGETGRSNLQTLVEQEKVESEESDTFLDAGVELTLKEQKVRIKANFLDVGPDFFSMAAQSRRVDLTQSKTFYNRIGNDRAFRMPSLFDLSRDRGIYNFGIADRLMNYDPRYANVMPFGQATPNRRGLQLNVSYGEAESPIEATLGAAFLSEIRGSGTFELKRFTQIRATANVNIHRMLDWSNTCRVTLGLQQESTTRDGGEIEQVDLSSTLLDVGLEAELFPRFDVLLGGKFLTASGSDYVPEIVQLNDIRDFPGRFVAEDSESLVGAGLRYRFRNDIYLTIQYQQFNLEREMDPVNDYGLRQVFAQYNMNF